MRIEVWHGIRGCGVIVHEFPHNFFLPRKHNLSYQKCVTSEWGLKYGVASNCVSGSKNNIFKEWCCLKRGGVIFREDLDTSKEYMGTWEGLLEECLLRGDR